MRNLAISLLQKFKANNFKSAFHHLAADVGKVPAMLSM
jgi:hypothetical protein